MQYFIQPHQEVHWAVFDKDLQPVFFGSKPECEDWLDQAENLQAEPLQATQSPSTVSRLLSLLGLKRAAARPQSCHPVVP